MGAHDRAQVATVHVLHGDEVVVVDTAEIEHLDDVGVGQPDREPRLLGQAPHDPRVVAVAREEPLDRQVLGQLAAADTGQEDLGHTALAQEFQKLVATELLHVARR